MFSVPSSRMSASSTDTAPTESFIVAIYPVPWLLPLGNGLPTGFMYPMA